MKLALVLLGSAAFAQTPAPVFEAADVHTSRPNAQINFGFLPNGRLEVTGASVLRLITIAWNVKPDAVMGGPSWIDSDKFDIVAKAETSASPQAMRTMLQSLLVERFGLEIKQEDKPVPVFALLPGKSGAAKEPNGSGEPGCQRANEEVGASLNCRNTTIAALADMLQTTAPGYFNHPVVDRSGLKGAFNFKLTWVARGQLPPGAEGASLSLFNNIEKQLGIKVEQQTAPMPVLTIAKVNRTPVDNPADTMEKLGPRPTQFDVADIKLSAPGTKEDFNMNNGRIQAKGILLRDMIQFAYDVEDDGVKGGDKALYSDRYDIVAKTAPTASEDTLRVMLRSLLADRFGLKAHNEIQPLSVYALTAGKPKLKAADPSGRTTCVASAVDGARTVTCTNVTLTQFAERIRDSGGGPYLDHPVVDLTGLKGSYDFTLSFSPRPRQAPKPAVVGAAGEPPMAEAPSGLTLFEAVDRQLGLKLTAQKHPMPVVVIDHLERKPTEN